MTVCFNLRNSFNRCILSEVQKCVINIRYLVNHEKILNINTLACGVWYMFGEKIFSHHMNLGQNSSHFVTFCHIFLIHTMCDVSPMWDIFFHINSLIRCQELFSGKTITLFHITLTIKMHHYVKYYFFSVFKSIFFS